MLSRLAFCGVAFLTAIVQAEVCEEGGERRPVYQLTASKCTCCRTLDDFISEHEYVYVLFYKKKGRMNQDIASKFERTADIWRWSRVFFGRIDTDADRDLAKVHMDPNMVPTNIIFHAGKPIEVAVKDLAQLRDKYKGGPEGQRWWLTKYLGGGDPLAANLQYASPLPSQAKLQAFLETASTSGVPAVIGFFRKKDIPGEDADDEDAEGEPGLPWDVFREFARNAAIPGATRGARFGAASGKQVPPAGSIAAPCAVLFLQGKMQASTPLHATGKSGAERVTADLLGRWLLQQLPAQEERAALEAAAAGAGSGAEKQVDRDGSKPSSKRRKRRRASSAKGGQQLDEL
eukprot:TRINITY_DN29877_c0_g1_i1.p1 TRINITY_DN29877_c0_g1~~TRINITY_DN29877_c0_g1_i1.p1  ORF type:complete len:346 (-),score=62.76 TRINITY_DN29877_c0_g1_i1:134-1171(-)